MAKQETMDAIEKTIDTAEYTVDTLERIPKVNLNGTTKQQQYIILGTVAGVSAIAGAMTIYSFMKRKLSRTRKERVVVPVPSVREPVVKIEPDINL